jgi:hypothetical protein
MEEEDQGGRREAEGKGRGQDIHRGAAGRNERVEGGKREGRRR